MDAEIKPRDPRKSLRQPGWITFEGGFATRQCIVEDLSARAVRDVVEIRCGAISGNMKVSFQAARSIG
jgi:hypothetical protein